MGEPLNLTSLNPYWLYIKLAAAVAVLALTWGWGYHTAKLAGSLALVTERNAVMADAQKQIEAAQAEAFKADEALRKAQAALPHTGATVAKAVHEHPTSPDCRVPDAVIDQLHEGISRGAQATSG